MQSKQNETIEKRFKCLFPGCDKAFDYKSLLERHFVIHTGMRPYTCAVLSCQKPFKRRDAVISHLKTHSEGELMKCPILECAELFTVVSEIMTHVRKIHHGKCTNRYEFTPDDMELLFDTQKFHNTPQEPTKMHFQEVEGNINTAPINNTPLTSTPPVISTLPSPSMYFNTYNNNHENLENTKYYDHQYMAPTSMSNIATTESPSISDRSDTMVSLEKMKQLFNDTNIVKVPAKNLQDILAALTKENQELKAKLQTETARLPAQLVENNVQVQNQGYTQDLNFGNSSPLLSVPFLELGDDIWEFN